jgi:RNA polymerase sigma factor (sigma-70 family)
MSHESIESAIKVAKRVASRYGKRIPRYRDEIESAAIFSVIRDARQTTASAASHFGVRRFLNHERKHERATTTPTEALDELLNRHDGFDEVDSRDSLERLLALLVGKQREVVRAVYVQGLSIPEAAESLGMAERTCRYHHDRAISRLRERCAA